MKLIILSGESSCGKTSSLKLLCNQIEQQGGTLESFKEIDNADMDRECVYLYNGRKIAVCTMGDDKQVIDVYCKIYVKCEIVICACNSDFMRARVNKPFEQALEYDPLATVVLKAKAHDESKQETENKRCAVYLRKLIDLRLLEP